MEQGHVRRVPDKPKEVHPRHKDGVRGPAESGRARRPHRLPYRSHEVRSASPRAPSPLRIPKSIHVLALFNF